MRIPFAKYQGTGNDFILIDNREQKFSDLTRAQIARLCDRRFGVGSDGLILLNAHPRFDFEMKNYNSDGGECSMCGNGGRSLVEFARTKGILKELYRFWAIDGEHEARVTQDSRGQSIVHLKMKDVRDVRDTPAGAMLDTGSPHLVCKTNQLMTFDVVTEGRKLRNSAMFMPAGINVNFVEDYGGKIFVRTYERGVEDETLSCGTGIIAAALVCSATEIETRGGMLHVQFTKKNETEFQNIWLMGPAQQTFEGVIEL